MAAVAGELAGPMAISWVASHATHALVWGYAGKKMLDRAKTVDSGQVKPEKTNQLAQRTFTAPAINITNWRKT